MTSFIQVFPDVLDAATCSDLITRFDADPNRACGTTGRGLDRSRKRSDDLELCGPTWQDLTALLRRTLRQGVEAYIERCPAARSLPTLVCNGFRMRRYPPREGFFDWHTDSFDFETSARVLAAIWYLNTPTDGGATEFAYHGERVEPRAGQLALFPTGFEYVHRSTPTRDDPKYIVVAFLRHPEPSRA